MHNKEDSGFCFLEQEVLSGRFFEKYLIVNWNMGKGRRKTHRDCTNLFLDLYAIRRFLFVTF